MHDIGLIQSILDTVVEQAEGRKPSELSMKVGFGALRFVNEENAQFWLEEMFKKEFGQNLDVTVEVETIMPEIKCACGYAGKVENYSATHEMVHMGLYEMACPKCGSKDFGLVRGQDCMILELGMK